MGKTELWMGKARVLRTSLDLFTEDSWIAVLLGSGRHPTIGFARGDDASDQSQVSGRWKVTAQYGLWAFGEPTLLKVRLGVWR